MSQSRSCRNRHLHPRLQQDILVKFFNITSFPPLSLDMSPTSRCSESKPAWFDEASIPALCWIGHPIPAVVLPIATCLLFAFSKYKQYRDRQRQPRQPEKYQQQQHDQDYVRPKS